MWPDICHTNVGGQCFRGCSNETMAVLTARTCVLGGILKRAGDVTPATGSVGCRWPSVPLVLMLRCFYVVVTSEEAVSNLHFGAVPRPAPLNCPDKRVSTLV
jgi:hypothetical protein